MEKETERPLSHQVKGLFLEFKLYSAENPPKQIDLNTCGNSILKGNTVKEIQGGRCVFEKLQIREVSSHFRNGWVFIAVQPRLMQEGPAGSAQRELVESIRPFVMDNVLVKAKLNLKKACREESSATERPQQASPNKTLN